MQIVHTTELLEWILLYLPLKDLLIAQLISRQCHDVIHASLPIRQALFLEPLPKRKVKPEPAADETEPWRAGKSARYKNMPFPPLLLWFIDDMQLNCWDHRVRYDIRNNGDPADLKPGSWREMLVLQPHPEPVEALPWLEVRVPKVNIEQGLRMKDLIALEIEHENSDEYKKQISENLWTAEDTKECGHFDDQYGNPVVEFVLPDGMGWRDGYSVPMREVCGWEILGCLF